MPDTSTNPFGPNPFGDDPAPLPAPPQNPFGPNPFGDQPAAPPQAAAPATAAPTVAPQANPQPQAPADQPAQPQEPQAAAGQPAQPQQPQTAHDKVAAEATTLTPTPPTIIPPPVSPLPKLVTPTQQPVPPPATPNPSWVQNFRDATGQMATDIVDNVKEKGAEAIADIKGAGMQAFKMGKGALQAGQNFLNDPIGTQQRVVNDVLPAAEDRVAGALEGTFAQTLKSGDLAFREHVLHGNDLNRINIERYRNPQLADQLQTKLNQQLAQPGWLGQLGDFLQRNSEAIKTGAFNSLTPEDQKLVSQTVDSGHYNMPALLWDTAQQASPIAVGAIVSILSKQAGARMIASNLLARAAGTGATATIAKSGLQVAEQLARQDVASHAVGSAAMASMYAAETSARVHEALEKDPETVNFPQVQAYIKSGVPEEDAVAMYADLQAARSYFPAVGFWTGTAFIPGFKLGEGAITQKLVGVGNTAIQGAIAGGGNQVIENVYSGRKANTDVGKAAVLQAITTAPLGLLAKGEPKAGDAQKIAQGAAYQSLVLRARAALAKTSPIERDDLLARADQIGEHLENGDHVAAATVAGTPIKVERVEKAAAVEGAQDELGKVIREYLKQGASQQDASSRYRNILAIIDWAGTTGNKSEADVIGVIHAMEDAGKLPDQVSAGVKHGQDQKREGTDAQGNASQGGGAEGLQATNGGRDEGTGNGVPIAPGEGRDGEAAEVSQRAAPRSAPLPDRDQATFDHLQRQALAANRQAHGAEVSGGDASRYREAAASFRAQADRITARDRVSTQRAAPVAQALAEAGIEAPVSSRGRVTIEPDNPDAEKALEIAANDGAESPVNEFPVPTDGQKLNGNYRMGGVTFASPKGDVRAVLENPAGSVRKAVGGSWSHKLTEHYGKFPGTYGADGEALDGIFGRRSHDDSLPVFIVHQTDPATGKFDELKVVMGARTEAEARQMYLNQYPRDLHEKLMQGPTKIVRMDREQFTDWLKNGDHATPINPLSKRPLFRLSDKGLVRSTFDGSVDLDKLDERVVALNKSLNARLGVVPKADGGAIVTGNILKAHAPSVGRSLGRLDGHLETTYNGKPTDSVYEKAGRRERGEVSGVGKKAEGRSERHDHAGDSRRNREAPVESPAPEGITKPESRAPIFQGNKRGGPHPVSVVGVHYSPAGGLRSLNPALSGSATREPGRLLRPVGRDADPIEQKVHFYVRTKSDLPEPERILAGGGAGHAYETRLNNLYDLAQDPDGIVDHVTSNQYADNPEEVIQAILDAGYDGIVAPGVATKDPVAVVYGPRRIPVGEPETGETEPFPIKDLDDGAIAVGGDVSDVRRALKAGGVSVRGIPSRDGLRFTAASADRVRQVLGGGDRVGRRGEVLDHPLNKDGKIIGAPEKYDTPDKLPELHKHLVELAKEGEAAKDWYKKVSEATKRITGSDADARLLIDMLANYSPHASVRDNLVKSLRAYYQIRAGVAVRSGMTARDKNAAKLAAGGGWSGEKISNFQRNLLSTIDPSIKQGVTIDIWMLRALGFGSNKEAPTAAQYRFGEIEVNKVANELGWGPEEAQAAIWAAQKARTEGDATAESAKDYADYLESNAGQLSWEAIPSTALKEFDFLTKAPLDVRLRYTTEVQDAIGNKILEAFNIPHESATVGFGGWEGKVNPSIQDKPIVARSGHGNEAALTPEANRALGSAAATYGLLLHQDGVAYHKPFYESSLKASNGMDVNIGRPLSDAETKSLYGRLGETLKERFGLSDTEAQSVAPIPTEQGVRFLNFNSNIPNRAFHVAVNDAVRETLEPDAQTAAFRSDGNMIENDWSADPHGQGYLRWLDEAGTREAADKAAAELRPQIEAITERYRKAAGAKATGAAAKGVRLKLRDDVAAIEQRMTDKVGVGKRRDGSYGIVDQAKFEKAVDDYEKLPGTHGGKVLSTDVARELSDDYLADRSRVAETDEVASQFVKEYFKLKLAEPHAEGSYVAMTAGGTGAGKTTALEGKFSHLESDADFIYDANMNKLGSSLAKIDAILDSGRDVKVLYVYRDPVEALTNGALKRSELQRQRFGTGRTVALGGHLATHAGSLETMKALASRFAGDDRVDIQVFDNTRGEGAAVKSTLDNVSGMFHTHADLAKDLNEALDEARKNGSISQETYDGFRKVQPDEPRGEAEDGRPVPLDRGGAGQEGRGEPAVRGQLHSGPELRGEAQPADVVAHHAQVAQDTKDITSEWKGAPEIVTVGRDGEGLPEDIRDEVTSRMTEGDIPSVFYDGKVYVFPDNIHSRADLELALVHETLGHYGLRRTFGDELPNLLADIRSSIADTSLYKQLNARYSRDYDGMSPLQRANAVTEEYLSNTAELQRHPSVVQRLLAFVRSWARKAGMVREWTENDVVNLMRGVAQNVRRGGRSRMAESSPAESNLNKPGVEQPDYLFQQAGAAVLNGQNLNSRITPRAPGESDAAWNARVMGGSVRNMLAGLRTRINTRTISRQGFREMLATRQRDLDRAEAAFHEATKVFDRTGRADNLKSYDEYERGLPVSNPIHRPFFDMMTKIMDEAVKKLYAEDPDALKFLRKDYLPHLWKDPTKAARWYETMQAKTPLEGSKGFTRQRVHNTLADGMRSGLEPISDNPVDLVLAHLQQVRKLTTSLHYRNELKANGWLRKMEAGERPPAGYARVDDPAFEVARGLQGYYAVPEMLARDLNDYLGPGLGKIPGWRGFRAFQNGLVSASLGWSGFHAGFTTLDNLITHAGVAIEYLMQGDPMRFAKALLNVPLSVVTSPFMGGRINKTWRGLKNDDWLGRHWSTLRADDPDTMAILDVLEKSGARWRMDTSEYNNRLTRLVRDLRRREVWHSVRDALPAIGEVGSWMIHNVLVPNQKMSARVMLTKMELDRVANQFRKAGRTDIHRGDYAGIIAAMNPVALRQIVGRVVDNVDDRLGQMTYDNQFMNKSLRQLGQSTFLSFGWLIGSVRTVTGGVRDIPKLWNPEKLLSSLDKEGKIGGQTMGRVSNRLVNLIALATIMGLSSAVTQYALSGTPPTELKDYFFPRTGRMNPDGSEERLSLPSYWMDHYKLTAHPIMTVVHKVNPLFSALIEIAQNQDYFGVRIYDPSGSGMQMAEDIGKNLASRATPFTFSNDQEIRAAGGSTAMRVGSFFGVTPAPASITRTPFQQFVAQNGTKGYDNAIKTPEAAARTKAKRQAEADMRAGKEVDLSGFDDRAKRDIYREARRSVPEIRFSKLSVDDKLRAYDMATPEERREYKLRDYILSHDPRQSVAFKRMDSDEQQAIIDRFIQIANEPQQ